MEKFLQIGFIGAGKMAEYHIKGFLQANAKVVAIVDKDLNRGKEFAQKWGFSNNYYTSITEMLKAHPTLDAVSIITPNKFHHSLVIEALKAKLHVFCEKPPALNAQEVIEMAQCAKENNKKLMFNLNNRARLDSQYIKKMIKNGDIGKINSAQATWKRRTGIPGFGGWFTSKAMAGGGPLIDLLHMIDLALWFMDYPDPEYVLAQTFNDFITDRNFHGAWGDVENATSVPDVESSCHGFIRFKSGQVLTIHNSWAEMVKEEESFVTIQAQKKGIHIKSVNEQNYCELYSQELGLARDQSLRFTHDLDMGRTRAPENFIKVLQGKEEPLTSVHEAIKLMKIIDAVYNSAESGNPVKI